MPRPAYSPPSQAPGFAARRVAAEIVEGVLHRGRSLDEQLDGATANQGLGLLSDRDRALVRRIVGTTLRRLGTLRHLVTSCLDRGLPAEAARLESALLVGAAQIHVLDIPDHAAVDLSVRLVQADRRSARYAGLVNAVLRRIARSGAELMADRDPVTLDTPAWLLDRWSRSYGAETARAIAAAHAGEPALDLTVKSDPEAWAARLRGKVLPTGSVRLVPHGPVSGLPGYAEGEWWVQDAAAALPARLLGPVAGLAVADLCAAPGGKTLQLAAAGARVTAIDRSEPRLARLRENLARVGLAAETVAADVTEFRAGPFDAVLLDAPCSSTGTMRRHPDIPWRKTEADLVALAGLQAALLDRAVDLLRDGGTLVYCTCSLEPEEGEQQIAALLDRDPRVVRRPVSDDEIPGLAGLVGPAGELRTLPAAWPDPEPRMGGLDGFFAARLVRR
ncbi:transcription antitermination factor NusB [Rhodoplanes sp. TEM]|uniref:Transcription antitermination factor NusB n=1 Tax=Rhodoplanes tepidamans TaxID=200616 RepID=A0ABT5JFZ0_RHOTP|nr:MULTISPECIES: transcription antitermination factor NusB [Rhodoplanes]MDC7788625.1 transcription antitermination factor NusB [Rhodoplanes tepidamans]MDC7982462.1 transcription antitermination factor NusB [Rhodoplanes sp. TEM]MDQ0354966.1 16S rRNA (cytosine967-C5)-methyltransferase [Rhodoplanes tepidamans]